MVFIYLLGVVVVEFVPGVVTIGAQTLHVFSLEKASLRRVSLSRIAPLGSFSSSRSLAEGLISNCLVNCPPVRGRVSLFLAVGVVKSNPLGLAWNLRRLSSHCVLTSLSHVC